MERQRRKEEAYREKVAEDVRSNTGLFAFRGSARENGSRCRDAAIFVPRSRDTKIVALMARKSSRFYGDHIIARRPQQLHEDG